MEIRDAVPDSARGDQAKSISDLCRAEHLNNPVIVALWLAKPGNSHVVAIEDGSILALASVTDAGEITLNHMSPDARFGGKSRTFGRGRNESAETRERTWPFRSYNVARLPERSSVFHCLSSL
jgi:hypothetical protein